MRKLFHIFLRNKHTARRCACFFLKMHNWAYRYAGLLSQYGEPDGLHPKHRLMNYHQWFVDRVKKDWVVLDVGCGNGALAYDLALSCRRVVAVDLNAENIAKAKRTYGRENIDYAVGDATDCALCPGADAVVLSNVLEHIDRRVDFLKKLARISPMILIRVPAIDRDWITPYKKELGVEWRLDPTHTIEYTFAELKDELQEAGLAVVEQERKFGEIYCVAARR